MKFIKSTPCTAYYCNQPRTGGKIIKIIQKTLTSDHKWNQIFYNNIWFLYLRGSFFIFFLARWTCTQCSGSWNWSSGVQTKSCGARNTPSKEITVLVVDLYWGNLLLVKWEVGVLEDEISVSRIAALPAFVNLSRL